MLVYFNERGDFSVTCTRRQRHCFFLSLVSFQNLDVNQAVNNLLSRDDEDGEDGEDNDSYLSGGGEATELLQHLHPN